jgi:hypothetical protein
MIGGRRLIRGGIMRYVDVGSRKKREGFGSEANARTG